MLPSRDSARMPPTLQPGHLSPHFTLAEFTASQTAVRRGIDNTPGAPELANLHRLAALMEDVRAMLGGAPVLISSGYRSPLVNKLVRGSPNSAHTQGLACDFIAPRFGTPLQVCRELAEHWLQYIDQLIFEGTWVHLAIAAPGATPRRQLLTAVFTPGKRTVYQPGLPA